MDQLGQLKYKTEIRTKLKEREIQITK